ncbi:hypothetical protein SUGI_0259720 [Cryptomeria japonica]|nr:hypothetical protein SUGI_0259720 [Cryptomeria japonica]
MTSEEATSSLNVRFNERCEAKAFIPLRGCKAAEHVVGADRGWDPQSAHNFQEWASSKIFRVGDNLWFAYSSAVQSVAEVNSREEWETCDVSNPIRLYKGGLDSVPLHSEGSRYFVSGRAEDCLKNGMKLHINVVPFNTSSPVNVKAFLKLQLYGLDFKLTAMAATV